MFRKESSPDFPALEARIASFWKERDIYTQSLRRRAGQPRFVFFEGPPTANGLPHPGHCLTRAIKDLFPRYRTMRGFLCERKAGWDTHGLPVEVEVCKELGIHSKEEIESYGVEPFVHRCLESVFRYTQQWERLTERLGFWIKLDEAYVTYHQSYVESVWWSLKQLFDRGLLYQGHKIVWWWAQGGTALSSGEVGLGYREVADPSVYVRFPLLDAQGKETDVDLLVWTTTPWTLPSNQFAAVHPDLEYATIALEGETRRLIVAQALAQTVADKAKKPFSVEAVCRGRELLGRRYRPPFDFYYAQQGQAKAALRSGGQEYAAWRVVEADFVTTDSGTGVVHQAPAFGEVDFQVLLREQARFVEGQGPQLICAVEPNGTFSSVAGAYAGRWVKEADKDISRELRQRGVLFHQEQYLHDYPFCWRADADPLIQYPRKSWFIRTTQYKDQMLANNRRINWLPDHIRDGRFGNFLETNVDWSLSRERYWGTPLPIWVCEKTGQMEAVDSYAELLQKPGVRGQEVWEQAKREHPDYSDHLKVHKPYIDAVTYDSPFASGARMRRVPEVIDCWYDSGAMPFAQWGYPHQGQQQFQQQFPADFISEALDQTRGWFYSLLAISTLLFGKDGAAEQTSESVATEYPHPFRNCIVLGLMLAEWWESPDGKQRILSEAEAKATCGDKINRKIGKMSKQLRNYRPPDYIFDHFGADALRWYFFANQAPWNSILYSEQAIKDSIPEFLLRLWNVYSFFVIYANIDGFDPAARLEKSGGKPCELDGLSRAALQHAQGYRPIAQRSELDRWIMSELDRTVLAVVERMDAYDNFAATGRISAFVDALSNWYVRRSRDRFWSGEQTADKLDAYWTLYECLLTTCRVVAPFTPFLAEAMWQNLAVEPFGARVLESVHLCDFPSGDPKVVDDVLSVRMGVMREIVSLGRNARAVGKLKVRQPLAKVELVLSDKQHQSWLAEHSALICEELNVKAVEFAAQADQYIAYTVLPDLKKLGPRLGKRLPALKKHLESADPAGLLHALENQGQVELRLPDNPQDAVVLTRDDLQVRLQAKPGWTAAHGSSGVVVLATELTPDLMAEGHVREFSHAVQNVRKDQELEYTDRIELGIVTTDQALRQAIEQFREELQAETLAVALGFAPLAGVQPVELKLPGLEPVQLYLRVRTSG